MKLKLERNGRDDLSWQTPKKISGCQEMLLRFTGDVDQTVRFKFH